MNHRNDDYVDRKVPKMQLPGKRKRGILRLDRRYLYVVKEDMQDVGVREDEVFDCPLLS